MASESVQTGEAHPDAPSWHSEVTAEERMEMRKHM